MANILIKQDQVDLSANSKVKEVVLYFNRAQVTRTRVAVLKKGENAVEFTNLGYGIDESSIKAHFVSQQASITSTSLVQNQLYFFKQASDEAKYQAILEGFRQAIGLEDLKTVQAMENYIIRDLREYIQHALNEILLEPEIPLAKLKAALALLESKTDVTGSRIIDINEELRIQYERLALWQEELAKIRQLDRRQQQNIEVAVSAEQDMELEIEVSYILPNVWWRTAYDAKLDPAGTQVHLCYYGEVKQATGELWENAGLVLSTSETTRSMAIPPVHPLYLSGYEQKRDKTLVIQRVTANEPMPEVPAPGGGEGSSGEPEPPEKPEPVATGKKGTVYTFQVLKPATIPADGNWHRVLIMESDLKGSAVYETVPESMEYVYRKANLTNTLGLPMLAGRVAVYRNENYMGKSNMKYAAPGEPFALSFGIDEDLKVKRMQVYKGIEHKKALLKNERYWNYRFILYNYKKTAQKVLLKEAVYHSRINEVRVEILDTTTGEYKQSDDGVVSWELSLPPDPFKHKTVELDFKVTAPKAFDLNGI